jgi:hypothetical protein
LGFSIKFLDAVVDELLGNDIQDLDGQMGGIDVLL